MNEVAVGQVFLSTLGLHLPIIIPSMIDYFSFGTKRTRPLKSQY